MIRWLLFGESGNDTGPSDLKNERDCYAVCICAGGGVLIRYLLALGFDQPAFSRVSSAGDGFAAVLLLHEQSFLAANMLGCYIMGLLLTLKPFLHPVLFTGLSTGLCGCITTFSSWMSIFAVPLERGHAYASFAVFIIEFSVSWSFFIVGTATRAMIKSCLLLHSSPLIVSANDAAMIASAPHPHGGEMTSATHCSAGDAEVIVVGGTDDACVNERDVSNYAAVPAATVEDGAHASSEFDVELGDMHPAEKKLPTHDRYSAAATATATADDAIDAVEGTAVAAAGRADSATATARKERLLLLLTFVIMYAALWCAVIVDAAAGAAHAASSAVRTGLRSVALAPIGAWCRWRLSKAPALLQHPQWKLPTLLANWLGTLLLVVVLIAAPEAGRWNAAIATGVAGSMSTVSTFVVELMTMYNCNGNSSSSSSRSDYNGAIGYGPAQALRYLSVTVAGAVIIVQIVYHSSPK